MPVSFLDTNVLVYLTSPDVAKAERARNLLAEDVHVSVQVLNEITNVARRKLRRPWREVREFLSTIEQVTTVHALTLETHVAGLDIAERYGLAIYDAQLVASAIKAGCEVLWSEDMQHGLVINGRLRILNPFLS